MCFFVFLGFESLRKLYHIIGLLMQHPYSDSVPYLMPTEFLDRKGQL